MTTRYTAEITKVSTGETRAVEFECGPLDDERSALWDGEGETFG